MRRIVNTLVRNGHSERDVIWNYSIEKSQRYYEDLVELEIEKMRDDAIRLYKAVAAAFVTESQKVNKDRTEAFIKYLDSLDLEKQKREREEKKKDPFKGLKGLVPFLG